MNNTSTKQIAKRKWRVLTISLLLAATIIALPTAVWAANSAAIPTFSIKSVVTDTEVTINTANFPANQTFTVRMGNYGTRAEGGIVVGTQDSGAGGSLLATYAIPPALKGKNKIAIRLENAQGYYAYNWFYNSTTEDKITPTATLVPANTNTPAPTITPGGPTPTATATSAPALMPPVSGYPYSSITAVTKGSTVTIKITNFTKNDTATVRMAKYGARAIGGTVVDAAYAIGTDGTFTATFAIPPSLASESKIAIRLESNNSTYYVYNWFWNNDH